MFLDETKIVRITDTDIAMTAYYQCNAVAKYLYYLPICIYLRTCTYVHAYT